MVSVGSVRVVEGPFPKSRVDGDVCRADPLPLEVPVVTCHGGSTWNFGFRVGRWVGPSRRVSSPGRHVPISNLTGEVPRPSGWGDTK